VAWSTNSFAVSGADPNRVSVSSDESLIRTHRAGWDRETDSGRWL
jgi:hypothetical protein